MIVNERVAKYVDAMKSSSIEALRMYCRAKSLSEKGSRVIILNRISKQLKQQFSSGGVGGRRVSNKNSKIITKS